MKNRAFESPVVHGRMLGRMLGFPTINQIPPEEFAELPRGVYFSRCTVGGKSYPAVSNLGVKPTVTDTETLLCETHIFGLDRDLYGQTVKTELLDFRRPEQRFGSVAELEGALTADIAAAREYFGI